MPSPRAHALWHGTKDGDHPLLLRSKQGAATLVSAHIVMRMILITDIDAVLGARAAELAGESHPRDDGVGRSSS